MSKVTQAWVKLAVPLAGLGLVFVYPPAGMGIAVVGVMLSLFSAWTFNVPITRAAAYIGMVIGAAAVALASGSWLLGLSVIAAMAFIPANEAVLRNNRDLNDYLLPIGALSAIVLAGLSWTQLSSKLWLIGPGLLVAFSLFYAMSVLGNRKHWTKLLANGKVAVGKALPVDVTLPARDGQKQFSLADHIGEFVLLVFIRGDWCPVCHVMLRIVSKELETLKRHGVRIAIISPTEGQLDDEVVQQLGLNPGMLFDQDSNLARSLDLIQKDKYKGKEVPLPVTILIDREGKVRHLSKPDDVTAYSTEQKVVAILEAA